MTRNLWALAIKHRVVIGRSSMHNHEEPDGRGTHRSASVAARFDAVARWSWVPTG